ncbi:hypothetical protein NCGM2 3098 [Pseudomonas aeruginosa]|jgi:hypothetical protein
MDK